MESARTEATVSVATRASTRAHARRTVLATASVFVALLVALVVAGAAASPIASKGKRKKLGKAAAATPTAIVGAAPSAAASPGTVVAATAAPSTAPSIAPSTASSIAPSAEPAKALAKLAIGKGTRVLVFGDSMVDAGFSQRLQKLVEQKGGTLAHDSWTSSTATAWSKGERLANLLAQHTPDVIIVALGANEVFLPAPEMIAPKIRAIVEKLGPKPCLWVSPPLWKGETGIVSVQRANAAPCGFFDSGTVAVQRAKDGIHPTPKGGSDWADAVWAATVE